jgi:hypothetical protein
VDEPLLHPSRLTGLVSNDLKAINLPTRRRFALLVVAVRYHNAYWCEVVAADPIASTITIDTSQQKRLPPRFTH